VYEEAEGEPLTEPVATAHANKIKNLQTTLTAMLLKSQETMQKYHNKHHKKIEFQIDDVI
jgi:hypothetical protein